MRRDGPFGTRPSSTSRDPKRRDCLTDTTLERISVPSIWSTCCLNIVHEHQNSQLSLKVCPRWLIEADYQEQHLQEDSQEQSRTALQITVRTPDASTCSRDHGKNHNGVRVCDELLLVIRHARYSSSASIKHGANLPAAVVHEDVRALRLASGSHDSCCISRSRRKTIHSLREKFTDTPPIQR